MLRVKGRPVALSVRVMELAEMLLTVPLTLLTSIKLPSAPTAPWVRGTTGLNDRTAGPAPVATVEPVTSKPTINDAGVPAVSAIAVGNVTVSVVVLTTGEIWQNNGVVPRVLSQEFVPSVKLAPASTLMVSDIGDAKVIKAPT